MRYGLIPLSVTVFLVVALAGGYVFSQKGGTFVQTQLNRLSELPFQEKLAVADSLLQGSVAPSDGIAVLKQVVKERRKVADREPLVAFFTSVAQREVDPAISARALKCAAATLREEFRFEEARSYWEAAFDKQPERTEKECADKTDLLYQIAEDDWFGGRWEKGLEGFVRFARDYADCAPRKLQMYAFFEAIPKLVKKIGEELPESTLVQEVLNAAAASDNAGERFAGAMACFARGDFDAALQQADACTRLSDDPRWLFHCDALMIGVCLRQKDFDAAQEIFDRIVEEGKEDYYLARYVSIDGLNLSQANRRDASLPLYTWFLESPAYTNPDRRENLSKHTVARIRLNHAIGLMHVGRSDDSFGLLQQIYTEEFRTDQGKLAGLIIAEHFLHHDQLDKAQNIVQSIIDAAQFDRDLWARAQLVLAQVQGARGSLAFAEHSLRTVLNLPSRPGEQDIETYRKDAQGFLNRLSRASPALPGALKSQVREKEAIQ